MDNEWSAGQLATPAEKALCVCVCLCESTSLFELSSSIFEISEQNDVTTCVQRNGRIFLLVVVREYLYPTFAVCTIIDVAQGRCHLVLRSWHV